MIHPNRCLLHTAGRWAAGLAFSLLLGASAQAATITINGVNCVAATTNADGSGNVTVTCGSAAPGAPTLGAVTPGNGQVTVAFTPGSGAAATSYTATCTDGSLTRSTTGSASPLTVGGLTNGTTYTCSVTASNAAGTSSPSASLAAQPHGTTPATAPGAPTIGVATPGDTTASLAFSAPASDGGSAIIAYQATCTPGATGNTPAASPITLSSLTNGTTYTCYVRAQNAIGFGPASATVAVTPVLSVGTTVPGAPTGISATAGNAMASIAFTAPAVNGGLPILDYTASCTGGSTFSVTGPASPILITGLSNGTLYSCTVTARNSLGSGAASAPPATVTPVAPAAGTVPPTMAAPTATALNASISVAFTLDLSGTAHLYRATCGGQTASGLGSPLVVTGLANGTPYTCTVAAHNAFGWSAESPASGSATPLAPTAPGAPPKPTLATAGSGQLSLSFTAPTPGTIGGTTPATITGYTVTCAPSGSNTGSASPITISGLTNTVPYTCMVKATNSAALTGPDSPASDPLAPVAGTAPGAPTIGTASVTNSTTVSVSYSAGAAGSTATDNYRATCTSSDGGATQTGQTGNGTVAAISVGSLTAGKTYTCTAAAHNSVGWSGESAASNTMALVVPNAPTIGTATAGNASASVAFTGNGVPSNAPAITGYRATCSPGGATGTGASSPITVSGLSNGTPYTCTVAAQNVVGYSSESAASNPVTPAAGPAYDYDWTTFNTSTSPWPGVGSCLTASGSTGLAIRFVPTAGGSNNGSRQINVLADQSCGNGHVLVDIIISPNAYDYSTVADPGRPARCHISGNDELFTINLVYGGTEFGNECRLTAGQTYYVNFRPNSQTGSVSKQLDYLHQ